MSLPHTLFALFPLLACHSPAAQEVASQTQAARPDSRTTPRNVAILVYDGVELLDFSGPGEVFSSTRGASGRAFHVYTVAKEKKALKSQGFVALMPEFSIADCPAPDIVVVPGGGVPSEDKELQAWVKKCAGSSELVMSVCNGALLLAESGLLDGLDATTHHGTLEALSTGFPKTHVFTNRRFVDSGKIMTCAGVSAGIDGALHVVERLLGDGVAVQTARYMEYDWRPKEIAALHAQPGRTVEQSAASTLAAHAAAQGVPAALAEYRALDPKPTESELNHAGYMLAKSGKQKEARGLLELAVAAFPDSANAHDSLSELLEAQGENTSALQHAERALALLKTQTGTDEMSAKGIHNASASRLVRLGRGDASTLRYGCTCGGACDAKRYLEPGTCPQCNMDLVEVGPLGRSAAERP